MKKNTQRKIFDFFVKKGFNDFIGVPDSTFSEFIRYGLKKNKIILQDFLIKKKVRGTIIVAKEGINATISGKSADLKLTINTLNTHSLVKKNILKL